MLFSYEFYFLVMFLSKSKSIMTIKGMSLLARGSKGNWELLANNASFLEYNKHRPSFRLTKGVAK